MRFLDYGFLDYGAEPHWRGLLLRRVPV